MKILLVNNFYYNRGGDCTYMFALKKLLEEKGHKVFVFSMSHPDNFESKDSQYFVNYINYDEEVKNINISSGLKVLNRTVFSLEARKKIEQFIIEKKPDIAHLQNIHHHITPSIFFTFEKYNIPIIWTLHDYTIICPNTSFLSHGKVCEKCRKKRYFWPSFEKCKKDSFSASTMAGIEATVHNLSRVHNRVDTFIAPSEFLKDKCIAYGINKEKIKCLHYFFEGKMFNDNNQESDYYLYVGRISWEKGVKTLIDAAVKVSLNGDNAGSMKGNKLKIVGDGPLYKEMISYTRSKDKNNVIEFLGHKSHEDVLKLIKGCRFSVIPSEWYENYPFAIIEAFICGKPAIGTKLGGIPELIKNTERGLLFEAGNSNELSSAIKLLLDNPNLCEEMGEKARAFVEKELSAEAHYHELINIYTQAISRHRVTIAST